MLAVISLGYRMSKKTFQICFVYPINKNRQDFLDTLYPLICVFEMKELDAGVYIMQNTKAVGELPLGENEKKISGKS